MRKSKAAIISFALMCGYVNQAHSEDGAGVFAGLKSSCQKIELSAWPESVAKNFRKPEAAIDEMDRCGSEDYLAITAHFKYDPEGDTASYFHPLYINILEATRGKPFSIIDVQDNIVIDVNGSGKNKVNIGYENLPQ